MTRPAPAVVRTTQILDFLSSNPGERFTLSQISRSLDINMASCLAILLALSDAGYVNRHHEHKTYALGAALVALGTAALTQHRAIGAAHEVMQKVSQEFDAECVASLVIGADIVIVAAAGRPRASGNDVRVGQRIPMIPPLGGIFMAWSSEALIDRWLDELGPDSTDDERNHFRATLASVRARGYSLGLESGARAKVGSALHDLISSSGDDRERAQAVSLIAALRHDYEVVSLDSTIGHPLSNIAAPVFSPDGEVVLGLTLQGFGAPLPVGEIEALADELLSSALQVTRAIGGHLPPW